MIDNITIYFIILIQYKSVWNKHDKDWKVYGGVGGVVWVPSEYCV